MRLTSASKGLPLGLTLVVLLTPFFFDNCKESILMAGYAPVDMEMQILVINVTYYKCYLFYNIAVSSSWN